MVFRGRFLEARPGRRRQGWSLSKIIPANFIDLESPSGRNRLKNPELYLGGFPRSFLAENDQDSKAWRDGFVLEQVLRNRPGLTPSFWCTYSGAELDLQTLFVIYPGRHRYPLPDFLADFTEVVRNF